MKQARPGFHYDESTHQWLEDAAPTAEQPASQPEPAQASPKED